MTASVVFLCGGRGGSGRIVTVRCDADGCTSTVAYSTREQYVDAGEAGWRRTTEAGPESRHACPSHSGVLVPT